MFQRYMLSEWTENEWMNCYLIRYFMKYEVFKTHPAIFSVDNHVLN